MISKFLTILMCLQLILFPVTGAMAEDTPEAEETQVDTAAVTATLTGEDTRRNWGHHMNQLLMLASSTVGTTILVSCVKGFQIPSIWGYFIGTGLHVGSEFGLANDFAERMKKSVDQIKMTQKKIDAAVADGTLHLEAVKELIKDQENLLDYAKARQDFMIAIMAVYWASMVAAIIEGIVGDWNGGALGGCIYYPGGVPQAVTIITLILGVLLGPLYAISDNDWSKGEADDPWKWVKGIIPPLTILITLLNGSTLLLFNFAAARAITFGALGGIATSVTVDLSNKVTTLEENITKLNTVKDAMEKQAAEDEDIPEFGIDATTLAAPSGSGGAGNTVYSKDTKVASQKKNCISGDQNGIQVGSASCAKPINIKTPEFSSDFSNPEVSEVFQNASTAVNALAKGDTQGAKASVAAVASSAGRMRDLAKQAMKKYNEEMKKQGKPEIDFDKEIAKRTQEFQGMIDKSFGANAPQLAAADTKAVLDAVKKEAEKPSIGAVAKAKTEAAAGPKNLFKGFGSSDPGETPGAPQASVSDNLDQYKSSVSDINNDKDVSIFALLSNRYVLSYDRVMNRRKKEENEKSQNKD
jgi:hypothetical protein